MYGKQDSAKFCDLLKDYLLPCAAVTHGENWTYQQDNAAIHRSFYTQKWFMNNGVDVLCSITTGARAEVKSRTAVYGTHVGRCAHV